MKTLLAILCLVPLVAFGAATVTFNLTDFLGTLDTLKRKQMAVQPLSTVRASGTNIVTSERRFYNIGTNALVILTNMVEGTYRISIYGGSYTSVFGIAIPDTNGNLTASDYLTTLSTGALETDEGTTILLDE